MICGGAVILLKEGLDRIRGRKERTITRRGWKWFKVLYWGVLFPVGMTWTVLYEIHFGEHPVLLGLLTFLIYVGLFGIVRNDIKGEMVDGGKS